MVYQWSMVFELHCNDLILFYFLKLIGKYVFMHQVLIKICLMLLILSFGPVIRFSFANPTQQVHLLLTLQTSDLIIKP